MAAPCPVWFASMGERREAQCRDSSGRVRARRKVYDLNAACRSPMVVESLADCTVPLPGPSVVVGAVLVKPLFAYDHLRLLTLQQREQFRFWLSLASTGLVGRMWFYEIIDTWCLPVHRPLTLDRSRRKAVFINVAEGQADNLLAGALEAEPDLHVPPWLDVSEGDDADEKLPKLCFRLPAPYVALCLAKTWTSIGIADVDGMMLRWKRVPVCLTSFPPVMFGNVDSVMEPRDSHAIAQEIRSVAASMDCNDEHDRDHLHTLHIFAGQLQNYQDRFDMVALHSHVNNLRGVDPQRCHRTAYRATFLVHCLLMCNYLRGAGNLRKALKCAVAMLLPPDMSRILLNIITEDGQHQFHVPHKTTIHRARFTLDVAYMLWWRQRNHRWLQDGGSARYGLLDSSPQGGADLELVNILSIPKRFLSELYFSAIALTSMWADDDLDNEDTFRQEAAMMAHMRSKMFMHAMAPMVITSGRGDLPMKYHSFLYCQWLESMSVAELAAQLREFVSVTSDQGVEAGISRIRACFSHEMFPWLHPQGAFEDDFMFAPAERPQDAVELSLEGSVGIAGCLHIIHNSSSDLESAMGSYKDVVKKLRHVANLVRRRDTKERLLETCFSRAPAKYLTKDIQRFRAKVYTDRWGEVAHCALEMRKIERALRLGWNKDLYGQGHQERQDEDVDAKNSTGCKVEVVDEAIRSEFWWGMLVVFSNIAKMLLMLFDWSESCVCHYNLDWTNASPTLGELWRKCPCRGKRAPCLVNGDIFFFINKIVETIAADLLTQLPARLSAEERTRCLQEFESARAHLVFVFVLRLSHWQAAPWCVFGCAHHLEAVAKKWLRYSLDADSMHPLFVRLRTELRDDALAWLGGEPLTELQDLTMFFGELRFAFTAERYIEGEHAKIHHKVAIAHHVSTPYLSVGRQMPEIAELLDSDETKMEDMSDHMLDASSKVKACAMLGLSTHPSIQQARHHQDTVHVKTAYHADRWTFRATPPAVLGDQNWPGQSTRIVSSSSGGAVGSSSGVTSDSGGAGGPSVAGSSSGVSSGVGGAAGPSVVGSSSGAAGSGSSSSAPAVVVVSEDTDDWTRLQRKYMLQSFQSLVRSIQHEHFYSVPSSPQCLKQLHRYLLPGLQKRDEDEIAFEDFMDGLGSTLDASYTEAEKQILRQFVSGTGSALKRPAFFFRLSHNYKYLKVNM